MKFEPAEDRDGLFYRRVAGNVQVGVYRVLYGYRIRAGFIGRAYCNIDWCCGADWEFVQVMYSVALAILSQREETPSCFNGIPTMSNTKPTHNDPAFMLTVLDLAKDVKRSVLERPILHP